jgi:hypothetical protein
MDNSSSTDQPAGAAFDTVDQYLESDNLGDKELRMPGGYYEEQQTSGTDNERQYPESSQKGLENKDLTESEALCARFKATLSRKDVKVHFVGAW